MVKRLSSSFAFLLLLSHGLTAMDDVPNVPARRTRNVFRAATAATMALLLAGTVGAQDLSKSSCFGAESGEACVDCRASLAKVRFADYAAEGDLSRLGSMLDCGIDVDVTDVMRRTALHRAADAGQQEAVELLVQRGAALEAKDFVGKTPLHAAAGKGHVDVVDRLLDLGAEIQARAERGDTPLHDAAMWAKPDAVRLLVSRGADVNARGVNDATPLIYAAACMPAWHHRPFLDQCDEEVRVLLENGAEVNAQGIAGGTPLQIASFFGYENMVRELLEHGADVNKKNRKGLTALHQAAFGQGDAVEIVRMLREHGAIDVEDEDGRTPAQIAADEGHEELAELLRSTSPHACDDEPGKSWFSRLFGRR